MNSFEKSLGHWLLKCIVQFHFCWFSINNQHSWQIPRYRGIPVFISVGSRLITKLRESHLYQKWRWWLHFHPLIFFTSTTTLGKLLKLFFLCMLKTFLFWLFFLSYEIRSFCLNERQECLFCQHPSCPYLMMLIASKEARGVLCHCLPYNFSLFL